MQDIPKVIKIKKVITETPFVKTFIFEYKLGAKPGQFVNLWLPRIDEKPMSVAYCDAKEFWVTMFAVGPFSKKMHTLKAGDLVGVRGPYGHGFTFKKGQRLVMMAGGYGAAPLYNLTVQAVKAGCKIDFVIGARSKDHLLYLNRIKKLKNVKLHITTDDGSVGLKGYNTQVLEKLLAEHKGAKGGARSKGAKIGCVYTCGPEMMMKKISEMCWAAKVPAQVSIERYMKCGFGVCGQCCVDESGDRMCTEGPVVDNIKARKIPEFGKYHRDSVGRVIMF
jgi:dihydroorotate dehydrogenase electron transfer subunit